MQHYLKNLLFSLTKLPMDFISLWLLVSWNLGTEDIKTSDTVPVTYRGLNTSFWPSLRSIFRYHTIACRIPWMLWSCAKESMHAELICNYYDSCYFMNGLKFLLGVLVVPLQRLKNTGNDKNFRLIESSVLKNRFCQSGPCHCLEIIFKIFSITLKWLFLTLKYFIWHEQCYRLKLGNRF